MSEEYRQSALVLHGLASPDRQWILEQLNLEQRRNLLDQLAELEELGMPPDRNLAEALLTGAMRSALPAKLADANTAGRALRTAPAQVVLKLLKNQPAWMVSAVLSIEAWPWRETIYMSLDARNRERVKQPTGTKLPQKLAQAMLVELESRLISMETETKPIAVEGILTRLSRGMRKWIRP